MSASTSIWSPPRGAFRGLERSEVLRSIIPVVPPGGHEFVFSRPSAGEAPDPANRKFSQFRDDIIYFEDAFSGVGFWPVPRPDAPETAALMQVVTEEWVTGILPAPLAVFEPRAQAVCSWACPNRPYLALSAMAAFAVVALLTWRSYYSGLVEKIAFRWKTVWIGTGGVLAALALLSTCDAGATWPPILLGLLVALMAGILVFDVIQRARNGPKP
ncbi:hypothetical protein [Rhodovulum marinum]|uniref:Uncharacterized protein n=1 Tax=Rhodovulum marinum TaxID=320662 RepID=A0A4V2SQT1_9RHOB|nr:hypothetical protein [Rhodovulum marinum]TCP40196.1 hypothetical protein EV662_10870 [Rhodovulum marinum]